MNLIRTLLVAGLLPAGLAAAQTEQWLEYHVSNEARSYHSLHLTTNPPPGVALPKLTAAVPYFAYWKTPMDPAGGRWLCLDRTRKSGPYDRLYLDGAGNGRLDDQSPVAAKLDSYNANFPAAPVTFKGEDGPITYHLVFRFYQYDNSSPQLLASSAGWYEGDVDFAGVKKHIQLVDGNVNGTFNDLDADPYSSDRIQVKGDKTDERFLGRMLEVDGKFFNVEVARDGAFIKVKPAENVVLGTVHMPENISEFSAFGTNGYFVRSSTQGEFTLPTGQYRMVRWVINRKDEKGVPWTLSGYNFPAQAKFTVAADQPVTLDIGEPVQAELKASGTGRLTFNLDFKGHQKESIELLRNGERPKGPKLMLTAADGSLCHTNTFEFG